MGCCRLEYMHSKGIVYRDLKPENTMISETGYPKLIDMGFAKRIHNRRTFSMCGTPDYMAPEIIKRQGHGKGVDYWALGCLIFEMITNTSPFNKGNDPPQVLTSKEKLWRTLFKKWHNWGSRSEESNNYILCIVQKSFSLKLHARGIHDGVCMFWV